MTTPKSGSFTVGLADGYDYTEKYSTMADINRALNTLRGRLTTAWNNDHTEGEKALKSGQCSDDDFRKKVEAIKKRKDDALKALEDTLTASFNPKTDLIPNLMDKYAKKWGDMGLKIDQLQGNIQKHVELDEWKSDGAQKYKQAAVNQSNAMGELRQLSFESSNAVSQVAQVNAVIFTATCESILAVADAIDTSPVSYKCHCCQSFYTRTDGAGAKLEGLNTWLSRVITTNGDWSTTAYSIGEAVDGVRVSGANLGSDGTWPQAAAGDAVKSETGDMASHTQQDMGTTSTDATGSGAEY